MVTLGAGVSEQSLKNGCDSSRFSGKAREKWE
jgi:hypothetical protein